MNPKLSFLYGCIFVIFFVILGITLPGCTAEDPIKTAKKQLVKTANIPVSMDHQDVTYVPVESWMTYLNANKDRKIISITSVALADHDGDSSNQTDGFVVVLEKLPAEKK